jgi:hypothetical protein
MQLWTDYEGVTIDGAYPLQKLLLPEGRSAFYSTAGPNGERKVVRLIECHFDEAEILARWRSVEALNHPHFLKFEHFGQTEIDGRPVVYAVLETVDANLAEVLDSGTLSVEDAAQLGLSLVAALDELHTHGFIHEHVEPRNVFAVNDTVKLRSDCIREAPEGEAGIAAKRRDVRDLVNVLLQGITQRNSVEGLPTSALPEPFDQIIRKGLDGKWGLDDIRIALENHSGSRQPEAAALKSALTAATATIEQKEAIAPLATPVPPGVPLYLAEEELNVRSVHVNTRMDVQAENKTSFMNPRWLGIAAIAVLIVIGSIWAHGRAGNPNGHNAKEPVAVSESVARESRGSVQTAAPAPAQPNADAPGLTRKALTQESKNAGAGLVTTADKSTGWRVIAYTYNRKADAEKKVSSIAQKHPDLRPTVFAPSGHSPYLVSIGGIMDQHTAHALAHRSRDLGLPHDVYAQNYRR